MQKICLGLYQLTGSHSGESFGNLILNEVLEDWNLKLAYIHAINSDNCRKETSAGKYVAEKSKEYWEKKGVHGVHAVQVNCHNHTLALAVQHASGQKNYEGKNSVYNNEPMVELMTRSRKLAAYFKTSGKATRDLNEIQERRAKKRPCVFPYDRPANRLLL